MCPYDPCPADETKMKRSVVTEQLPSLFIRWGEFQVGAFGSLAIIAVVIVIALFVGAKWRGIL
jgi:hypothetical protein